MAGRTGTIDLTGRPVGTYYLRVTNLSADVATNPATFELTSVSSPAVRSVLNLRPANRVVSEAEPDARTSATCSLAAAGDDTMTGGSGSDWIFGGDGNDVLSGGLDSQTGDLLFGGPGDDLFQVTPDNLPTDPTTGLGFDPGFGGADLFVGGGGNDRAFIEGSSLAAAQRFR